jgi:hypothetical protein
MSVRLSALAISMTGFGAVLLFASPNLVAQDDAAPPQLSDAGADTCLGCHNSPEMLVIFTTAHGQQADPESPMANLQCKYRVNIRCKSTSVP